VEVSAHLENSVNKAAIMNNLAQEELMIKEKELMLE